jgi:D-sedoheptulose 7-phosphate isomerase
MANLIPDFVARQISESITVKEAMLNDAELINVVESIAVLIVETYRNGGKVLLAGNGGSAADAQHIAAELVSRFTLAGNGLDHRHLDTHCDQQRLRIRQPVQPPAGGKRKTR